MLTSTVSTTRDIISDPAIFSPSSSQSLNPAQAARRARLNVIIYYRVISRAPAAADAATSVLYQSETIFSLDSRVRESVKNIWKFPPRDGNHSIHVKYFGQGCASWKIIRTRIKSFSSKFYLKKTSGKKLRPNTFTNYVIFKYFREILRVSNINFFDIIVCSFILHYNYNIKSDN